MTLKIGIVLGSTRPGRNGEAVAKWVLEQASQRTDATFELIDLKDHPLPHLDEPMPASFGQYLNDHTRAWSQTIATFDGYVFVTPEYNHSTSGVLKNAIDYLYSEWNNKALGIVSYGGFGGLRAAEALRLIAAEVQLADVREQVALGLRTDFDWSAGPQDVRFAPGEESGRRLTTMLDQLVAWSSALAPLRAAAQG